MEIVYARSTGVVALPAGGQMTVREGSHWPANDPVVLAQPSLFSADPRHGLNFSSEPVDEAPVETATARPGEKRQVRRG